MVRRVFLDANVLIDTYDTNRPLSNASKKALQSLLEIEGVELFTSCDIVTTIYYIRAKDDRVQARRDILHLNAFCHIVEFGNAEVLESCRLMEEDKRFVDLEDTIQFVMAKKVGADLILSNDRNFVSEGIVVADMEGFLSRKGKSDCGGLMTSLDFVISRLDRGIHV